MPMRTEKKLSVQIQAVLPPWLPPAQAEVVDLVVMSEQRGLHMVKNVKSGKFGYSRDYLTTSDDEAVRNFMAEHGKSVISVS
jgi:hypothetical protein